MAAGGTRTIPVQSAAEASANTTPAPCGVIPSSAQSYSINITVVPQAQGVVDYVSLWPAGLDTAIRSDLERSGRFNRVQRSYCSGGIALRRHKRV